VNENQEKGNYKVGFDASGLNAGNYFYSIQVSGSNSRYTKTRLMQVN